MMDKDAGATSEHCGFHLMQVDKRILKVTAETIQEHENPLAMEGHTYGLNHHRDRYTNWELSTKHPDY